MREYNPIEPPPNKFFYSLLTTSKMRDTESYVRVVYGRSGRGGLGDCMQVYAYLGYR